MGLFWEKSIDLYFVVREDCKHSCSAMYAAIAVALQIDRDGAVCLKQYIADIAAICDSYDVIA